MDWLEFVSSAFGSIAGPVTLLIVLFSFRKPLQGLIPLLQKLKYKEIELEFNKRVEGVSAEVVL